MRVGAVHGYGDTWHLREMHVNRVGLLGEEIGEEFLHRRVLALAAARERGERALDCRLNERRLGFRGDLGWRWSDERRQHE